MRNRAMIRILTILSSLLLAAAAEPPKVRPICGIKFESPQQVEKIIKGLKGTIALPDNGFVHGYTSPDRTVAFIFTSPKSAAHPAVVCRFALPQGNKVRMITDMRCGGKKTACEKLAAEYRDLDRQIAEQAKKQAKPKKKP